MLRGLKQGFTMSEVLITLGIIGIVASMTLPQLIINYQKQETVSKLKKAYTIVNQAIKHSEIDNESMEYWDYSLSGHKFYEKYLKKYFIQPKEISTIDLQKQAKRKLLNGNNYSGTTFTGSNATHFQINDGIILTFNLNGDRKEHGLWAAIDVNGLAKPNTIGKDTFLFYINPKTGFLPLGYEGSHPYWTCPNCNRTQFISGNGKGHGCSKNQTGYWCGALIMNDNWEIKDDYPW